MRTIFFKLSRSLMVMFLVAGAFAFPATPTRAAVGATIVVNSNLDTDVADSICTLREALQTIYLNADWHGCIHTGDWGDDLIVFAIAGNSTITLTSVLPSFSSQVVNINGWNSGNPVVIDGNDAYRVFDVQGGTTLTLQNITVENGYHSSTGGGIVNTGTLNVINSSFLDNVATEEGGAIENNGVLTIANSTFSGNEADWGGAVSNNSGTATILNSTFSGNTADMGGGALLTNNGGSVPPTTTVKNTILANSLPPSPTDCFRLFGAGTMTGDHNIIETTSGTVNCDDVTTSTADPMLGSLTGAPAYLPLLAGSPAKDTGDDATCATYPVSNTSQNHIPRPQDAHCEIGAVEAPFTVTFRSVASQDGWILESTETSGSGGSLDSTATEIRLGDETVDRQYRAILSFNTGPSLPDTAVITSATLMIKKTGTVGGVNPFLSLGSLLIDIKNTGFSSNSALQLTDFKALASKNYAGKWTGAPTTWNSASIGASSLQYVNPLGGTQFRLRFTTDDNDNGIANYIKFASGNAITTSRPQLIITYYVP